MPDGHYEYERWEVVHLVQDPVIPDADAVGDFLPFDLPSPVWAGNLRERINLRFDPPAHVRRKRVVRLRRPMGKFDPITGRRHLPARVRLHLLPRDRTR